MSLHRRRFIQSALVAGAGLAMGGRSFGQSPEQGKPGTPEKSKTPLRILILGGTGFLGPACMEAALAQGHSITLFNRGRLETIRKDGGRPSVVPEGVEVLYGNRDPEKFAEDWKDDERQNPKKLEKKADNPKGLSQLVGKKWDAVIDTSAYFPRMAKASAELLAPSVKQYVFISTLSVYKDTSKPITEDTPLATLSDPNSEEFGESFENYGAGKAACEAAVEAAMPGRVTDIRPGFIVGPRDTSSRFLYWPLRVRRGGEVVMPGSPEDLIQIIDVRDLAQWTIRTIEEKTFGVFNATGPGRPLSMREMVEGCKKGLASSATFTWIPLDELGELKDAGGKDLYQDGDFPLYVPPSGEGAGFHKCDCSRAIAKGLTFRPVAETAPATLAWYDSLPEQVQKGVARFSLTEEREKAILEAWKAKAKKPG
jgi:2'-hydroxyisoflavone reductase